MEKLKLVIFDLDGVLLDSEPLHTASVLRILKKRGIVDYDPTHNVGMSSEEMFSAIIKRYHLCETPEQLVEEMTDYDEEGMKNLPPSQGLLPLLDFLSDRGIKLGVASSSERRFVHAALTHLNLLERFPFTAAGTEAPRKKPYPDLYQMVLQLAQVPSLSAAAIEDSATGILAAKAAGLFTVGYQNPTSGNQDLSGADRTVCHLQDAISVFLSAFH